MPPSQTMEEHSPHQHHQSNGTGNNHSSNSNAEWAVMSPGGAAASRLIRQLDAALADARCGIVEGARDREEARKNARRAAELARRFATGALPPLDGDDGDDCWDAPVHHGGEEQRGPLRPPPAPPSPPKRQQQQQQHRMNGDATTAVSTTPSSHSSRTHFPTNSGSSSARAHRLHGAAERLARQHADELLQVSLELERTRQLLEREQMAHDETRSAWQQSRSRQQQLERQLETAGSDLETARCESGLEVDRLQTELERARERTAAAEEDADLACEIARGKEAERSQMEEWLRRALGEIQDLRAHIAAAAAGPPNPNGAVDHQEEQQHPETSDDDGTADYFHNYLQDEKTPTHSSDGGGGGDGDTTAGSTTRKPRRVHFQFDDDEDDDVSDNQETAASASANVGSSSSSQRRRPTSRSAMVAAGRQLLQQHRAQSPLLSAEASAQRRRRLRSRLQGMILDDMDDIGDGGEDDLLAGLSWSASKTNNGGNRPKQPHGLGQAVEALDVCRHAAQVLKESGCRLHLTGRWWNNKDNNNNDSDIQRDHHDEIHLDTLARHYTAAVEVLLDRKHKEVQELESLCTLWEGGAVSPTASSTASAGKAPFFSA